MSEIVLFDFQKQMLARVQEALRVHRSVMVQMPAATGKTFVLAALVASEGQRVSHSCVWVVVHRTELVDQIVGMLQRFGLTLDTTASPRVRVMSIQWLSRHRHALNESPTMIVLDEAHHAVANTYASVLSAFPSARRLGLTATPCRLDGRGFTDIFDVLLTSWSMQRFIAEGWLCPYDFYSIRPDSDDQRLVDSLSKHGTDGDYLPEQLTEVMDVHPSLERLCATVHQYASGMKGIVYACSIRHACHIAEVYRSHGIEAVAISSLTPSHERKTLIDRFRHGDVRVLVSVDILVEGFDCPDVEFVQLARPTLSLARYLQMVGRALRVAEGKRFCVILDNVGLYRRFGMPSALRDWQAMFQGTVLLQEIIERLSLRVNGRHVELCGVADCDAAMTMIASHEHMCHDMVWAAGRSATDVDAVDSDAFVFSKRSGRVGHDKPWLDPISGIRFASRPYSICLMGINFATCDGLRLYPRIRSRFVDDDAWLTPKTLELQMGAALFWKGLLIVFSAPHHVFRFKKKVAEARIFVDDNAQMYVQANAGCSLMPVNNMDDVYDIVQSVEQSEQTALAAHMSGQAHGRMMQCATKQTICGKAFKRGFVSMLQVSDWCYVLNLPAMSNVPLRSWQVVADDNVCVVSGKYVFLQKEPRLCFWLVRRNDDLTYIVVREYDTLAKTCINDIDITIMQTSSGCLTIQRNGVPYTPHLMMMARRRTWH